MLELFTPYEYLLIDVANCYGLDRKTWQERIAWTRRNKHQLEILVAAKEAFLYRKAVRALRRVDNGDPTNHIMGLDATASGIQIMAATVGCRVSAEAVNVIDNGLRNDLYEAVAVHMCSLGADVDRDILKRPCMTHFYSSMATPRKIFGEGTVELRQFYQTLEERLPGANALQKTIQGSWDPQALYYNWKMPDNHYVRIPVLDTVQKSVEIDELDHAKFSFRSIQLKAQHKGRSLSANIVHSMDAWICRGMVALAAKQGFQLAPVHK